MDHPFADGCYILRVIAYLRKARKQQGLGIREITQKSGVKKGMISKAEKQGCIPSCREFKAWTQALGVSWEHLWSRNFPSTGAST